MTTKPTTEALTLAKTIASDIFHGNRPIEEIALMIEGFTIQRQLPKPTTEAVDALSRAARLSFDDGVFAPHEFIRALSEEGFTITSAEPAMSDDEHKIKALVDAVDHWLYASEPEGFAEARNKAEQAIKLAKSEVIK